MTEKKGKNLPVSIEDQVAQMLAQQKGQLGALPTNKIGLKDKKFHVPGRESNPGPLTVVVLDFVWALAHYPGVYNPANPQQPNCVAIGRDKPESGLLAPHEESAEPQAETCSQCPKNEWPKGGGGKPCKNQRRLVVVPPDATEDTEAMTLFVSPSSLKNFDAYVARLENEHGLHIAQVVTEISFDPNVSYSKLVFKFGAKHDNLNLMWSKREQAQDQLFRVIETGSSKQAA